MTEQAGSGIFPEKIPEDDMEIKIKSRDPFVRASFERTNAMGKGRAILSDKDRKKQNRSFRKREFLNDQKRSGYDDGSFFSLKAAV